MDKKAPRYTCPNSGHMSMGITEARKVKRKIQNAQKLPPTAGRSIKNDRTPPSKGPPAGSAIARRLDALRRPLTIRGTDLLVYKVGCTSHGRGRRRSAAATDA
eukprot:5134469-Prymnesium_polylepis.1